LESLQAAPDQETPTGPSTPSEINNLIFFVLEIVQKKEEVDLYLLKMHLSVKKLKMTLNKLGDSFLEVKAKSGGIELSIHTNNTIVAEVFTIKSPSQLLQIHKGHLNEMIASDPNASLWHEIIVPTIADKQVFTFSITLYDKTASNYPGYDSDVKVHLASVKSVLKLQIVLGLLDYLQPIIEISKLLDGMQPFLSHIVLSLFSGD